ncbi:hypothetical protein N7495_002639 [Penicillium taxi]|uniref:uncharacterized protein n=1 Tax=Penicillium taxi TaxID=168475 RepID=UPI002544F012|nr:uncharacterized protein N7495_002639 [Penicillium taxi]KAJ5902111.1 hypothetical protein N7495_002639 [Penicillium taxi]
MQWPVLLVAVPVFWSTVVAALPTSSDDNVHTAQTIPYIDPTLTDPLWLKYGLNASAEYKYFHEPGRDDILGHYDSRFFTKPVGDARRSETLTHMIRAYLNFFNENNLETWIAHGTLLGWWWNGKILPWDWDVDTQVPETTLAYLGDHFNQTLVEYSAPDSAVERRYLIDINPWSRQRERGKGHNIIDARWIDIDTGLYIDITGLSRLEPEKNPDIWQCKNFHKYNIGEIYPLRWTTFEGVSAKVPFQYDYNLIEEYSRKALTNTKFQNHTWLPELAEWVPDKTIARFAHHSPDEDDERQYE